MGRSDKKIKNHVCTGGTITQITLVICYMITSLCSDNRDVLVYWSEIKYNFNFNLFYNRYIFIAMHPLLQYASSCSLFVRYFRPKSCIHDLPFDCIDISKQLTKASFWIKWVMEQCTLTKFLSGMVWQFIIILKRIIANEKHTKERNTKDRISWLWQRRKETSCEPMISISIHKR
mgnify:CR=1 FL=1